MSQKLPIVVLSTSDVIGHPERLTKAFAAGHVVHVASTREKLAESDEPWRRQVESSGGRIFLATPNENQQEAYSSGWRACLAALGHEWPTQTIIEETGPEPLHWLEVQRMIDADRFPGLISRVQIDKM